MKTKIYFMFVAIMLFLSSSIIVCPSESTEITYYPDPEDCASYYECDNGILIHSTCPDGLLFNPNNEACDWDYNTDCGNRPLPDQRPDKNYWREKQGKCQCMDIDAPNGIKKGLDGTHCVTTGNGRMCTYTGLCNVSGYSNCFIQSEEEIKP